MWDAIANFLPEFLATIFARANVSRAEKDRILLALSDAYHETQAYYASLNEDKARDVDREYEIARLWDHLSMMTQRFDDNFADRFGIKSRYWREGAAWTDDQVRRANIGLEKIWRETKAKFKRPRKKRVI